MNDPELDEIFTDPAHREVVDLLKASRPATTPPLDPHFRSYLRAKLMTEAQKTLPTRASRSWFASLFAPRTMVPAIAAVAAGFLIVLGIVVYLQSRPGPGLVAVDTGQIANKTNVATAEPIVIKFTGPVDKAAVEETVQIEPATSVTKQWVGQTLVITPDHPLAPGTNYSVTFKPKALPPSPPAPGASVKPTVAPTPVVVHFSTIRAPIPPVLPPSFKSSSVSYGFDSRLADSGTVLNGTWTPSDQLLVTRPAGLPGPGSLSGSANPSPGASSSQGQGTDVWLMTTDGKPIRLVAPGGNLPAAAPSGGLFAVWHLAENNQSNLEIRDLQGGLISTAATVDGAPDHAAVWVGTDRIAFVDHGTLRIVGLHAPVGSPNLKVDHGSLAASANGQLLAVQSTAGSLVLDVTPGATLQLPDGATSFSWSARGDLAFVVQRDTATDLYVLANGKTSKVATSPNGQAWSDLNWSPDASSILLSSKPTSADSSASVLMLINRDGTNLTAFGPQREYSSPQWSPAGAFVLFTRRDEAGGKAFWTATSAPSDNNSAEKQALAEVEKFMEARIHGDTSTAQDELDDAGRAAYQSGASTLLSDNGAQFSRYYPVTVQLTGSAPQKFLVGVRIFISKGGVETSFFEEQLSLTLQNQRYLIDGVKASTPMPLGHGPTIVSVQVVPGATGQQVRVRFDADLKADTVSSATMLVKDGDGKRVDTVVSFDADNHLAIVTAKLRPGTYQLVVTTGVTDVNGTSLAQEYDAPLVIAP